MKDLLSSDSVNVTNVLFELTGVRDGTFYMHDW